MDGEVVETGQHRGEVFADRDLHATATLYYREDRRNFRSGLGAADVDPVLSANRDGAHGVLREVVG